ncbi:hypothetical protein [Nocardia sp. NPDC052112]|uniref:hypothetical protein n=1 Tax=Nocardia sp. NPDC052112 TaxID=3155646 RepID=UPI00341B1881
MSESDSVDEESAASVDNSSAGPLTDREGGADLEAVEPDSSTTIEQVNQINQYYNTTVHAPNSQRGMFTATAGLGHRTERLDSAEIENACRCYVLPDGFDVAFEALSSDRVVLLDGKAGVGKRTGAIKLLREVTPGPLFALPPTASLEELANREYEADHGYLAADMGTLERQADTDFTWRMVRDRVNGAGAWLIVAGTGNETHTSDRVLKVPWNRPDAHDLLTVWLSFPDCTASDEETVNKIAAIEEQLPSVYTIGELHAVALQVCEGADPIAASRLFEVSVQNRVRDWFSTGQRTRRQILEVAVLAFLGNCGQRPFESLLSDLQDLFAKPAPPDESIESLSGSDTDVLPEHRHTRVADASLIRRAPVEPYDISRQVLEFRDDAYRKHVIAELWERMDVTFWDCIRDWLRTVILRRYDVDADVRRHAIADGLAQLAAVSFDEVENVYLEPWSKGKHGWTCRNMAIFVLWSMCFDRVLAPTALRTAVRWSTVGTRQQQWTATHAFSGVLGIIYPEEASRYLSQLIIHSSDVVSNQGSALATLFARLAADSSAAEIVLTTLEDEHRRAGASRRGRSSVLSAIAEVLTVTAVQTEMSAIFGYIDKFKDQISIPARLWGLALCHRPFRRRLLDALLSGLGDLTKISSEPEDTVQLLGAALATEIPPREHASLEHDLTARQTQRMRLDPSSSRSNGEQVDLLLRVLLAPLSTERVG